MNENLFDTIGELSVFSSHFLGGGRCEDRDCKHLCKIFVSVGADTFDFLNKELLAYIKG